MTPLRVGIVGAGNISGIYLKNLGLFPSTEVVAIADLDPERAQKVAAESNVPHALSTDELLTHPDVDLVLNLTIPAVHGEIARRAIENGKHVHNEKPLAVDLQEAKDLIALADAKGLKVGCAPDTFLGAGQQRARAAIDAGRIGTPVHVQGFMLSGGPESWHPSPEFFYKKGGGPLLDMGPYYLTAFVNLFGPIESVTSATRGTGGERTIGSEPLKGQKIQVETPTTLIAALRFRSGVIGQLTVSFDAGGNFPNITVFGTEGVLTVPDPNNFDGATTLRRNGEDESLENPLPFPANGRGVGVADIARSLNGGGTHRASGALALHILEAMLGIIESGDTGRRVELTTDPGRPAPLGEDLGAESEALA